MLSQVANFVNASLRRQPELVGRLIKAFDGREMTVGSICSGFGVGEMVLDAINDFLESNTCQAGVFKLLFSVIEQGTKKNCLKNCGMLQVGRLRVAYSCECDKKKVEWLLKAFPDTPVFTDMKDLHTGRAFDARSQMVKSVPKVQNQKKLKNIEYSKLVRFPLSGFQV